MEGSAFAASIASLDRPSREREILQQVFEGNVPDFWRRFVTINVTREIEGKTHTAELQVAPDYLAVGSDNDSFLTPLSPEAAQEIADKLDGTLPTTRMVDEIYRAAAVRLNPSPIPPSPVMNTVPVFLDHNLTVTKQRTATLADHPLGALVAAHKKDVVITVRLPGSPGKVAIYGWHKPDGNPIQPLYLGHGSQWVDYSHGIRMVRRSMLLDGKPARLETVLSDPLLCPLLSDEGPLTETRYSAKASPPAGTPATRNTFAERTETLRFEPGIRVLINSPQAIPPAKPIRLVLYALPNGNSIEQTIGRKIREGDDKKFDIQHIGAQTRWLRGRWSHETLIVAYLECAEKAWPAWRRKNDPEGKRIGEIVETLRNHFAPAKPGIVLTGHSGGGSFTFGYLNGLQRIPDDIERIAFLDSNYAYDATQGHTDKLTDWLKSAPNHYLCVLAYHDSIALLNGKTFVSESGGTWGRSLAMRKDLGAAFKLEQRDEEPWQRSTGLDGRLQFILRENPKKAILHTVQVELNGFIHAMLTGTELEGKGYSYFGPRAYEAWIATE